MPGGQFIPRFGSAGKEPVIATFRSFGEIAVAVGTNPVTVAGLAFGSASGNRRMVCYITYVSAGSFVSATLAGIAMTVIIAKALNASVSAALAVVDMPSGITSGNLVATFNAGTQSSVGCLCFSITGLATNTPIQTSVKSHTPPSGNGQPAQVTSDLLTYPANSATIMGGMANAFPSDGATSLTGLTRDFEGGSRHYQAGHRSDAAASSGTSTLTSFVGNQNMAGAIWAVFA
jgi:hypothetical protein